MEFKVGDRIQIKSWEEMEEEFGLKSLGSINCELSFNTGMKHLCGRYATIADINNKVKLKDWNDTTGDLGWFFSTDMIKKVDEPIKSTDIFVSKPLITHIDDSIDSMRYAVENNLEENGGDNMKNEILELYRKRKFNEINRRFTKRKKEFRDNNVFVKRYNEITDKYEKDIKELYNSPENDGVISDDYDINESYFEKKYNEYEADKDIEQDNLMDMIEEIQAQLSLSNDLDYQLEVLTRYGIIDKKTKKMVD